MSPAPGGAATYRRFMGLLMALLLLLVVAALVAVCAVAALQRRPRAVAPSPPRHPPPPLPATGHQFQAQIAIDAAALMPEIQARADRLMEEAVRGAEEVAASRIEFDPESSVGDERASLGASGGPSWLPAEEWAEKVVVYRGQGRSHAEIRSIAEYLEQRGPQWPTSPKEKRERAERLGLVLREDYMSPELEAEALQLGPTGFPDVRLEIVRDRLLVVTPHGWVNPKSRTAATRAGLWSFTVRGTGHHQQAAKWGDFSLRAPIKLVREPDNPHDPHAIAVYARRGKNLAGYVPRGYAKRLAKLMDAGKDLVAVSTRGSLSGHEGVSPQVLVVERSLWEHLNR